MDFLYDKTFCGELILIATLIFLGIKFFEDIKQHVEGNIKINFLLYLIGLCIFIVTLFFGIHADIISEYDRFKIKKNNWFNFGVIYTYPLLQATLQNQNEVFLNELVQYDYPKQAKEPKRGYTFVVDKSYSTKDNPNYQKYNNELKQSLKNDGKSYNMNEKFEDFDLTDLLLWTYINQIFESRKYKESVVDIIFYYGTKGSKVDTIRIDALKEFESSTDEEKCKSLKDEIKKMIVKGNEIKNKNHKTDYSEVVRICKNSLNNIQKTKKIDSYVLTIIGDFENEFEHFDLTKELMFLPTDKIFQTNLVVVPSYKKDDTIQQKIVNTLNLFKNKHFQYAYLYSFETNDTWLSTQPINIAKSALAINKITDSTEITAPEIFLFKPYRSPSSFDTYKAKIILDDKYGDAPIFHFTGKTDNRNSCVLINNNLQYFINVPKVFKNDKNEINLTMSADFSEVIDFYLEIIPTDSKFRLKIPINLSSKLPNNSAWFLVFSMGLLYISIYLLLIGIGIRAWKNRKYAQGWRYVWLIAVILGGFLEFFYIVVLQFKYLFLKQHCIEFSVLIILQVALVYLCCFTRTHKIYEHNPKPKIKSP
ncbi:MAG: hypothetical protein MUF58_09070 [Arcicella sp.]|jgi:uncharacterized membrane protein YhaH (DUF805 family)|nr:hypothetical protein [Arcicella sp.]